MSEDQKRMIFYDKEKKEICKTLDFPEDIIVNGGETATQTFYVKVNEPYEYEVFSTGHEDPNADAHFNMQGKILKPNQFYELVITWSPPIGNKEALQGKVIIDGRFIIRY